MPCPENTVRPRPAPNRIRGHSARAVTALLILTAARCAGATGTLYVGTDNEEFLAVTPDHIGRYTTDGPNVLGGALIDLGYPLNGIALVGGNLVVGEPSTSTMRLTDLDGVPILTAPGGVPNACCNEDMAYDTRIPANPILWHVYYGGQIDELDPNTWALRTTHAFAGAVGITVVGSELWVSNWNTRAVGPWDPVLGHTQRFLTPTAAGGLAWDAVNGVLWVGQQGGLVVPFDLNGVQLGAGFQPLGNISNTIDSLEFLSCVAPPTASASPTAITTCGVQRVTLDGSPSSGCASPGLQYRWLAGATEVCPWSTTPTCDVSPLSSTTYRLEVACLDDLSCQASTQVTVTVVTPPLAAAGSDLSVCPGNPVLLDGSGSVATDCPGGALYEWREGPTVLRPWDPTPTWSPPTGSPGSRTYTLAVSCAGLPACMATDEVTVTVIALPAAAAGSDPVLCPGDPLVLDGSASSPGGCTGGLLFEWREGPTVLRPWDPSPTWNPPTGSPGSHTYTLAVSCAGLPACTATDEVTVTVIALPAAAAGSDVVLCLGDPLVLDGSASSPGGCAGGLLYEWREGATVLRPWDPSPTWNPPTGSPGSHTYTLAVSCNGPPSCSAVDDITVVVQALPVAAAGSDVNVCRNDPAQLNGLGSAPGDCRFGLLYEWRDGATVVRPASPIPGWNPPTTSVGTTTYTLVVSCVGIPACAASDSVDLQVRDCPLAVRFLHYEAIARADGSGIELRFATLSEVGTLGFVVERAPTAPGPFTALAVSLEAKGSGSSYALLDTAAASDPLPWYRIVEIDSDGSGDVTPPFLARRAESVTSGRSERSRGRAGRNGP